jgi:orotidine-5'-phosphate decarboxylase
VQELVEQSKIEFPFGIDGPVSAVDDLLLPEKRLWQKGRIMVPRMSKRQEGAMYSIYEAKTEPAYYLIDKNGILRASPTQADLTDWIEQLLAE